MTMEWDTGQTDDAMLIAVECGQNGSQSGNILIIERDDRGVDFGHAEHTNPHLIVHSADAPSATPHREEGTRR